MNLIELVIVQIISSVEDEKTFSTLFFVKSKLQNHLTGHLNIAICMFAHYFSTKETFPFHSANTYWNDGNKVRVGVNA
jgi:hypothetical protein